MATQHFHTRREVATALGISRQRLEKLIAEARIVETPRGIDMAAARAAYEATIDPGKRAAYEGTQPEAPRRVRGASAGTDPHTGKPVDFATARAEKEVAHARRAQLEYQIRNGAYILRDDVTAKEFAIARKLRERILGLPARLANFVVPEAMASIIEECEALVREMQDDVAAIAEDSAA